MLNYTTQTGASVTVNDNGLIVVVSKGAEHKFNATGRNLKNGMIDFGFAKITIPADKISEVSAILTANDAAVLKAANEYAANDFSARMDRRMYGSNASDGV